MAGRGLPRCGLLLLLACGPGAPPDDARRPRDRDGTGTAATAFVLEGDTRVALPYAEVGETVASGVLRVRNAGDRPASGPLAWTTEGPFTVSGSDAPLAPGEERALTVTWTGDAREPALYSGVVRVESDGQALSVGVGAVVGDPELPASVNWAVVDGGVEATVSLPSAPFPYGSAPYDDDAVYLFVPDDLTDRHGIGVVTHLHGHRATLDTTLPRQEIRAQHALSGRDAVLIAPQGPEDASDSDFGRLDEAGGFARLVRDVFALLYRDGFVQLPEVGGVALTAHSGGYNATANLLEVGGLPVGAVHLFDALYAREDTFRDWVADGGVLRSSWTAYGGTDDENVALATTLTADGLTVGHRFDDDALDATRVSIAEVPSSHDGCVAWERNYARWLTASGLPVRPRAPPSLRGVLSDGTTATVTWREDPGGEALRYIVQGSEDGVTWSDLAEATGTQAAVPARPWIRLLREDDAAGRSDPSDTYGGTGADWLVVDAFDRVLDGSWTAASQPFAAWIGVALGARFSVASNEAVESGDVELSDYTHVLWMLGDEGVNDLTFSAAEQAAIETYLAGGGRLIASGAEIGYATDAGWLSDALHASYVADDAGTDVVAGYRLGAAYPEDYPDVLAGERTVLRYDTGTAAAVAWSDRVVVAGFGLENLPDSGRTAVLAGLIAEL